MSSSFTLQLGETFSGPLDLLLQLVEQENVQVTEIALSQVTDAYLQHLRALQERRPEEMADFLLVATRLLVLKARLLMPWSVEPVEEEEGMRLPEQLALYRDFAFAARALGAMVRRGVVLQAPRVAYASVLLAAEIRAGAATVLADKTQAVRVFGGEPADVLREQMQRVLRRLAPFMKPPEAALQRVVTLEEKIAALEDVLEKKGKARWRDVVGGVETPQEVVVSFLALLELVKQQRVVARQEGSFGEIELTKAK